jgi:hypothetical protein
MLLVSGIFFISLAKGPESPNCVDAAHEIPLIGFQLDTQLILLSGPLVLSFLILAFSGAVRAFNYASAASHSDQVDGPWIAEKLDVHPNAIDMMVYHTPATPRWIVTIGYFAYPLYLTIFLVEAAWLWYVSIPILDEIAHATIGALSVLVWLPACWQVAHGWIKRLVTVREGNHLKGIGQRQ